MHILDIVTATPDHLLVTKGEHKPFFYNGEASRRTLDLGRKPSAGVGGLWVPEMCSEV